tara:strand:- start:512 stop:1816 length:1305 start_codon:yes stop_codon:yes gene_type:complete
MKIILFFLTNFILLSSLSAQSINFKIVADSDDTFYLVRSNSIVRKDLKNNTLDSIAFRNNSDVKDVELVFKKAKPFVVSRGSGMVWKISNDSLIRIDKSYDHKMTNGSKVFAHNDTIFKFGGYGYWSNRNFFTYFSENSKEWEYYKINPKSYMPPGLSGMDTAFYDGTLYLCGGAEIEPNTGRNKRENGNVFRFDFSNKTWTDLGVTNFYSYSDIDFFDIGSARHLVTNAISEDFPNYAYILDYTANKILPVDNWDNFTVTESFVINDTIFSYNGSILKKVALSDLDILENEEKSLYLDAGALFKGLTNIVVVAVLVLLVTLVFLHNKNKNKPKLDDSGFRYKRIHYTLSRKELIVLKSLIHNKNVDSKSLLKALWEDKLSAPQNNRIKLEVIESLNQKVSKVVGVKQFIRSKKSAKDHRMQIYYTNYRKDFLF